MSTRKGRGKRERQARAETEEEELTRLTREVLENAAERGTQPQLPDGVKFSDLCLSERTLKGLQAGGWEAPTEIQYATLSHALAGRDILGAAKTGSGKTLAFLVPLLERLYREKWGLGDGLGALIITPTRELALQIFEVLRLVGKHHNLSAALITGGKAEFDKEQAGVPRMNVLVCTPGRLLQHLEQTPGFDASTLQVLVLDEADRILDMGFSGQLNSIMQYLPTSTSRRQTMLFSATQTKSVKDLARLSLRDPEYIFVHEQSETATPEQLVQHYIVCPLPDKLDVLFSFIKTHLKSKILVFFATCAQVRYAYEMFRGLQPGVPLLALHGKFKQARRTLIYFDFLKKKEACLFATDIAARGLDFPAVDWVVQVDCPEDASMYIHRVGRTARFNKGGRAMLFLLPNEETPMCTLLERLNVPIKRLSVNPKTLTNVKQRAASIVASQPECKLLAKKAFLSYMRSVALMPNKEIFDVSALPLAEFSDSLGLPLVPSIPTISPRNPSPEAARNVLRSKKNKNRALDKLKKQIQEMKARNAGANVSQRADGALVSDDKDALTSTSLEDEEFLTVKRVWGSDTADELHDVAPLQSGGIEESKKRKRLKTRIRLNESVSTLRFDDEGNAITSARPWTEADEDLQSYRAKAQEHTTSLKHKLDRVRGMDRKEERDRVRDKHRVKRLKAKESKESKEVNVPVVVLANPQSEGDDETSPDF